MSNFTYKCVPVPETFNTGKKSTEAVSAYERIINGAAEGGWELVSIDTVTSVQQPGCLSGLFGSKPQESTLKILVFRK